MALGRPLEPLNISEEVRSQLESISRSRSMSHALVRRAKIVLMSDQGRTNQQIGQQLGLSGASVGKWRRRFCQQGLMGLYDELRPGSPRLISDERIAALIHKTLKKKPKGATHWTCRSLAAEAKLSKSTVQRVWKAFGLQPHRQKPFQLSNDPFFVEKVRDLVGLYLNPPDQAMVLCVDEKSPIQALERTQPLLPLGLGYVEGVTHSYFRHGTTTLFAALEIASGKVLTQCKSRHRHQEFLQFLKYVDKNVPEDLDIHLVVDNYVTHKHDKVKRWIASRPRYHVHYTPTYACWLNQVEIWFGIITRKAIRRGSFKNVKDLIASIQSFTDAYNARSRPFVWTATADSILAKMGRLYKLIYGTQH